MHPSVSLTIRLSVMHELKLLSNVVFYQIHYRYSEIDVILTDRKTSDAGLKIHTSAIMTKSKHENASVARVLFDSFT